MSVHHAQAVDLSMIILEESEDPILRAVARDIARTQQEQIGRMQGWLMQWELPARGTQPAMAWMSGHGGHGPGDADGAGTAPMPGLVSEEEMERLRGAKGQDAEILFLRLMIDHHRGGIEMAEAEVVLGEAWRRDRRGSGAPRSVQRGGAGDGRRAPAADRWRRDAIRRK